MTDVVARLIKLKPNVMENVEAWKNELSARKDEAIDTLKHEGVSLESWFHVNIEGEDFLMVFMRTDDIEHAFAVGKQSTAAIDQVHKAFKQNWAKGYHAMLLLDLENTEKCGLSKPID